jgi:hypothetical protein
MSRRNSWQAWEVRIECMNTEEKAVFTTRAQQDIPSPSLPPSLPLHTQTNQQPTVQCPTIQQQTLAHANQPQPVHTRCPQSQWRRPRPRTRRHCPIVFVLLLVLVPVLFVLVFILRLRQAFFVVIIRVMVVVTWLQAVGRVCAATGIAAGDSPSFGNQQGRRPDFAEAVFDVCNPGGGRDRELHCHPVVVGEKKPGGGGMRRGGWRG